MMMIRKRRRIGMMMMMMMMTIMTMTISSCLGSSLPGLGSSWLGPGWWWAVLRDGEPRLIPSASGSQHSPTCESPPTG